MYTEALQQLREQRTRIDAAIAALEGLNGKTPPAADEPQPRRKSKRRAVKRQAKTRRAVPAAAPSNGNGGTTDSGETLVLQALRKRNTPMKPIELASVTKLSRPALKKTLIHLAKQGHVIRSGHARGSVVSLPGASPAKERL